MSEFVSNFLTYLTVSLFGAACFLVSMTFPEPTATDTFRAANALPLPAAATGTANNEAGRADTGEFQEAVLEAVVFTAGGIDDTPGTEAVRRPTGTVTGQSVNLRAGPGTNHQIAGRASRGDALPVTGQRDGIWFEVIEPVLGQRVWIHGNFFKAPEIDGAVIAQN